MGVARVTGVPPGSPVRIPGDFHYLVAGTVRFRLDRFSGCRLPRPLSGAVRCPLRPALLCYSGNRAQDEAATRRRIAHGLCLKCCTDLPSQRTTSGDPLPHLSCPFHRSKTGNPAATASPPDKQGQPARTWAIMWPPFSGDHPSLPQLLRTSLQHSAGLLCIPSPHPRLVHPGPAQLMRALHRSLPLTSSIPTPPSGPPPCPCGPCLPACLILADKASRRR